MTNINRHEKSKQNLRLSLHDLDTEVATALLNLIDKTTSHHTLRSKQFSLIALVRSHLDPAISNWKGRNGLTVPWKFSDLLVGDQATLIAFLERLSLRNGNSDSIQPNEFSRTCDALIDFVFFCANHPSNYLKVVITEPADNRTYDEVNERLGWGRKKGSRKTESDSSIPDYLTPTFLALNKACLCVACGKPTLEAEERQRLLDSRVNREIKESLRNGTQYFSNERGSYLYCADHSTSTAGESGARMGHRIRVRFMSLLLAMTRKGIASRLNKLFPPTYELEFARLAIADSLCRRDLKIIEDQLSIIESGNRSAREDACIQIFSTISRIFLDRLKLSPVPFEPEPGSHSGAILVIAPAMGRIP